MLKDPTNGSYLEGKPLHFSWKYWWTRGRNLTFTVHLCAKQGAFISLISTNHISSGKSLITLVLQMRKLRLASSVMCIRIRDLAQMESINQSLTLSLMPCLFYFFVFGSQVLRVQNSTLLSHCVLQSQSSRHLLGAIFISPLQSWCWSQSPDKHLL